MYNPYAIGRRVYLRHPTEQDAEGRWHEWFSDEETALWIGSHHFPNSVDRQREFYRSIAGSKDRVVLSIVDKETDRHIGVCNLNGINWVHRYADLAIVIGEPEFRNGPHVIDAFSTLIRVAFMRLNLRIVKGGYMACNEASKSILDLLRFKEVGRITDLYWVNGAYVDSVSVALRQEDWLKRNLGADE